MINLKYSNHGKETKREEFLDAMDAITLFRFRHMLEKNKIGEKIFADRKLMNKRIGG